MSWGVRPSALIGHSLGEYVAACLAGVFSLDEALALVAARGRLVAGLAGPPEENDQGAMASLPLPEAEVLPRLTRGLALAAVNGPSQCVVSGRAEEIEDLLARLAREGVQARRLHTSHAFHSELMDPVLEAYAAVVGRVRLSPPRLPCISNLTGTWLTAEQATDPAYWVRHLRETVRFGDGLATLVSGGPVALLEVGPGRTLTALARRHPAARDLPALPSLRHPEDDPGRSEPVYASLAHLWTAGVTVDWAAFQAGERRRRVRLPTYPFERRRYWVDLPPAGAQARRAPAARRDLADWFHVPYWRPAPNPTPSGEEKAGPWLVFLDDAGVGERLLERWRRDGVETFEAVIVRPGGGMARRGERDWTIDPRRRQDYDDLLGQLGALPARVVHLWGVGLPAGTDGFPARLARLSEAQDLGLYSLLFLIQALNERIGSERVEIAVVTSNALRVTGAEALCPEKATVLGLCQTIPSEHPSLGCRHLDLELPLPRGTRAEALLDRIAAEVRAPRAGMPVVAFRGVDRWVQGFEPAHLDATPPGQGLFRERGVYLLTGGLGGIALEIAEHLAATTRARLVLVGRSGLQPGEEPRASRVRRLRELGAEVMIAAADVADLAAMRNVVSQAIERFGRIDGVIHAAGLPGGGLLALRSRESLDEEMRAKLQGTLVVGEICRETLPETGPSFLALCSSVNSFTGQIGQSGYAAANNFLDAYAPWYAAETGIPTVALNWDRWQGVGMAVGVERLHRDLSGGELMGGIAPAEGVKAFERALASGLTQVVVSWLDFAPWLQGIRAFDPAAALAMLERARAAQAAAAHPRTLETEYVPPGDELEEQIAGIWQEVFGLERVGIHDDFFALGGDSLVALQLVSRIGKTFGVELKVGRLFETPTIAGLAVTLEEAMLAAAAPDELERALDEMEVHS
jgi:NADP-dependent 3-hydroxy acid dehydrogenase YdfG/acyl carrier protein